MYRYKSGHLLRVFGNCKLVEINAGKVESYVSQRLKEGAANHSLAKELTALRRILKLAKHVGEYSADIEAVMPFDFAPQYKPRVRFLTDYNELQRLLLELPAERAAHVCFMLSSKLRFCAACQRWR